MNIMIALQILGLCLFGMASAMVEKTPTTVSVLDPAKYSGLWYQMYADKIVYDTFEKDSYCDTAKYTLQPNGDISVHNYAKVGSPNGTDYVIDGYAYNTDPNEPGKLKVHFDSDNAAPFDAPYWVLMLGPINAENQYDWSIVSDNVSRFLFVLARDTNVFYEKYNETVYDTVIDIGFTGRKQPIPSYQGVDCIYEN
jgi:apolipoprotein D and lipocalin family protein